MRKSHILGEIKRTAKQNGGRPLGRRRFERETGIKEADWLAKYWTRWNDALHEAGYAPNAMQGAYADEFLLQALARLIQRIGKFPTAAEIRLEARLDPQFPSHNTFRRFGGKRAVAERVLEYCGEHRELAAVAEICQPVAALTSERPSEPVATDAEAVGFVYLLKAGRYYKIGHTNSPGRRTYELGIQLPDKPRLIHTMKTDDPSGIEAYWHRRFAEKRARGEWFQLSPEDVRAFRRRKFM